MARALHLGVLTVPLLVQSISVRAYAEDAVPEREAQARFEEGVARVKAGNIEGARISFAQAYALERKPTVLWNLALAEEKTGHALEALNHFRELARVQSGDDRVNAEKHIAALTTQTGHLDVIAPAGTQLLIDGAAVASLPLAGPVDVSAGRHHLEVHTGQGARDADVEVQPGQLLHVSLIPPAEERPMPPAPVSAPPAATAPTARETGASTGRGAGPVVAVILLGTAAAASLSLGVYFALQSHTDQSTAEGFHILYPDGHCSDPTGVACAAWKDAVQSEARDATLSNVLYVAGGALAAGAVAAWLFWPRNTADGGGTSVISSPRSTLSWVPSLGPGRAGIAAMGRF